MATTDTGVLHLDGKTLEGGGQLLRLALSLSCLTGKGIHVTDIRGNRMRGYGKKATKGGGMKRSHAECVKWLARAVQAEVTGLEVGSSELIFRPRLSADSNIDAVFDEATLEEQHDPEPEGGGKENHTGDVDSSAEPRPRHLRIVQKTPGAVYLIVQALLPYLLFGPCCRPREGEKGIPPVILRVVGGTNVSSSPSHEYTTKVLLPTLTEHLRLPPIETKLIRRGWSAPGGPAAGSELGEIQLKFSPVSPSVDLPEFQMRDEKRGKLRGFDVSIIAHPEALIEELDQRLHAELDKRFPGVSAEVTLKEDSHRKNRVYVLVVAKFAVMGDQEGTKVFRMGRDALFDGRERPGQSLAVQVAKRVVGDIASEVAHGGCVDEHLQDQLIVFQALTKGKTEVSRGSAEASLHTQTARWVSDQILSEVQFDSGGGCNGMRILPD